MTRDVIILLSTYNGQTYLGELLESLRTQTAAERVHLLIRDDGSTDATRSVLAAANLSPLAVGLIKGPNLGLNASFATLARAVPQGFSTIMLCDQDDVWLPDKVALAAEALSNADPETPTLYCSRSTLTDADLNPIGLTADARRGPSLRHALFQNIAPGHTMAFNPALLRLFSATFNDDAIIHDWWLYLLAVSHGQVIFDPEPHAYYRQHGGNEIGYSASRLQRLRRDLRRLVREDRSALTQQGAALARTCHETLTDEDRALLAAFLDQDTLSSRLAYLRRYPMVAQQRRLPGVSSLLFLLGRYRVPV
jgi:glycosyltransferase involved in cell wall biosynthesis